MYWPDYSLRKKKKPYWRWVGVALILVFSFVLAGKINGWWPSISGESGSAVTVLETAVPTIPTLTPALNTMAETVAPDFTLPDLFVETLAIQLSDYAGRPVILNFWASWCGPCRVEMPALQQAYEEQRDQGLVLLGVNQTFIDDLTSARDFVTDLNLTFPNVRDDTGEISQKQYRALGLPTTVFIAADGTIAHVQVGQLSESQITTFSQKLVAGEPLNK